MSSRGRSFVGFAAVSLLVATMLGAYASHGMRAAPAASVDAVRTAVAFQFYHGLGLLAVALLEERLAPRWTAAAGWLFIVGTVLFCGAIYVSELVGFDAVGAAAPFGGTAFMAGWAALAVAAVISARRAS
ncbi:MAG TPA: DUF423 domain-containing protein [Gammaproteobacteria bacterium]